MRAGFMLLVCLGILACNRSPNLIKEDYPKHVQLARFQNPDGEISKLSSVAKSIRYIPLETTEDCLIGLARSINPTSDGVLIAFKNAIYYFGNDGKYRSKIDHIGKGPGEYLRILPQYIHDIKNQEVVLPDNRQALLCFDYSGKLLRTLECKSQDGMDFSSILPDGNYFLGPLMLGNPMFKTFGADGKLIKKFFPGKIERQISGEDEGGLYFPRLWMSNHHEGVLASEFDTTWLVKDAQTAIPFMIIDPFLSEKDERVYVSPINYLNHNYIGFAGRKYGIYSLIDDKYYTISGTEDRKLDDDIDNGLPLQLSHSSDGIIYSLMNAIDLLEPDNPNFHPKKNLAKIIDNLHENDNPVLRIITLRDEFVMQK